MAVKSVKLKDYRAKVLPSRWNFGSKYLFDRLHETCCVARVAYATYSLDQVHILEISPLLGCLLHASVNIANSWLDFPHYFPLNFHRELFRFQKGRMLRTDYYVNQFFVNLWFV